MKVRCARHTNDLEPLRWFYTEIMGLQFLGEFTDHNGYDGIFLGTEDPGWHLEFTSSNIPADHTFDEDDILVFYPGSEKEYDRIIRKAREQNIPEVEPKNPYWKKNAKAYLDPDGFRVMVSAMHIGGS